MKLFIAIALKLLLEYAIWKTQENEEGFWMEHSVLFVLMLI